MCFKLVPTSLKSKPSSLIFGSLTFSKSEIIGDHSCSQGPCFALTCLYFNTNSLLGHTNVEVTFFLSKRFVLTTADTLSSQIFQYQFLMTIWYCVGPLPLSIEAFLGLGLMVGIRASQVIVQISVDLHPLVWVLLHLFLFFRCRILTSQLATQPTTSMIAQLDDQFFSVSGVPLYLFCIWIKSSLALLKKKKKGQFW